MNQTEHFKLNKPAQGDFYNVDDFNENADIIDTELQTRKEDMEGLDKRVSGLEKPNFEDYTGSTEVPSAEDALVQITSGKSHATLWQYVKAFFKGCVTMGMIVNNCVTNRSDLPGSAAQLKVLMDLYTRLNSEMTQLNSEMGTKLTDSELMAAFTPVKIKCTSFESVLKGKRTQMLPIVFFDPTDNPFSFHNGYGIYFNHNLLHFNECTIIATDMNGGAVESKQFNWS